MHRAVCNKSSLNNPCTQATEGVDVIQAIHSDNATNYAIWFVKKGAKKSVLKLQESGPGGLAEVRAGLDESKVLALALTFTLTLTLALTFTLTLKPCDCDRFNQPQPQP